MRIKIQVECKSKVELHYYKLFHHMKLKSVGNMSKYFSITLFLILEILGKQPYLFNIGIEKHILVRNINTIPHNVMWHCVWQAKCGPKCRTQKQSWTQNTGLLLDLQKTRYRERKLGRYLDFPNYTGNTKHTGNKRENTAITQRRAFIHRTRKSRAYTPEEHSCTVGHHRDS